MVDVGRLPGCFAVIVVYCFGILSPSLLTAILGSWGVVVWGWRKESVGTSDGRYTKCIDTYIAINEMLFSVQRRYIVGSNIIITEINKVGNKNCHVLVKQNAVRRSSS